MSFTGISKSQPYLWDAKILNKILLNLNNCIITYYGIFQEYKDSSNSKHLLLQKTILTNQEENKPYNDKNSFNKFQTHSW